MPLSLLRTNSRKLLGEQQEESQFLGPEPIPKPKKLLPDGQPLPALEKEREEVDDSETLPETHFSVNEDKSDSSKEKIKQAAEEKGFTKSKEI